MEEVLVLADALREMEPVVRMGLPWAVGVAGSFVLLVRWIDHRDAPRCRPGDCTGGGCVLKLIGRHSAVAAITGFGRANALSVRELTASRCDSREATQQTSA
jgi:hypothetical protein